MTSAYLLRCRSRLLFAGNNLDTAMFGSMDSDKVIIESIADRLKAELDAELQRLPAEIVEKLFAIEAAEMQRNG